MRSFFVIALIFIALTEQAFAASILYCGISKVGRPYCDGYANEPSEDEAINDAMTDCKARGLSACAWVGPTALFSNQCRSVAGPLNGSTWTAASAPTSEAAEQAAIANCERRAHNTLCTRLMTLCDLPPDTSAPPPSDSHAYDFLSTPEYWHSVAVARFYEELRIGFAIGLGILIIVLALAKRAAIHNFIINGNLPYKLVVYGDDIEVLFTRTQRVNWYGRVVFGIVARLGMTDQQLLLVRRYWLGRVIAFDSFRRYRQNQLARVHLQLAVDELSPAKPLQSLWNLVKRSFFFFFYLLRALASLLFGFLFIRVTIAALARGKLVESKDLALLLEARTAIEQCVSYLKEYLDVAETFDGREELFEPEGPQYAVMEAFYGRGKTQPEGNARVLRPGREAIPS